MKSLTALFVFAPFAAIYLASLLHSSLWPSEEGSEASAEENRPYRQKADRMADAAAAAAATPAPAKSTTAKVSSPVAAITSTAETPGNPVDTAGPLARERERQEMMDVSALEQDYDPADDFAIPDGFSLADSRHD